METVPRPDDWHDDELPTGARLIVPAFGLGTVRPNF